jgi:hypothetical protein
MKSKGSSETHWNSIFVIRKGFAGSRPALSGTEFLVASLEIAPRFSQKGYSLYYPQRREVLLPALLN